MEMKMCKNVQILCWSHDQDGCNVHTCIWLKPFEIFPGTSGLISTKHDM